MKYKDFVYEKMVNEDAIEIKSYEGTDQCVKIPSHIDDLPVRSIGYRAFARNNLMKSIHIPNTINWIRTSAFNRCTSLEEVQLPNSKLTVDDMAFSSCRRLTKFKIPRYVEHISKLNFICCYNLEAIDVDDLNENYCSIDGILFSKDMKTLIKYPANKQDPSYIVPNSVRKIEQLAFAHATHLQKILLPQKLEVIKTAAFENSGLIKVTIPNSVSEIDNGCFNCCEHLEQIVLSKQLTCINQEILANCPKLQPVTLPPNIEVIDCSAFAGNNPDFYVQLNKNASCIELLNPEQFTKFKYRGGNENE